jgi:hypothetical protein
MFFTGDYVNLARAISPAASCYVQDNHREHLSVNVVDVFVQILNCQRMSRKVVENTLYKDYSLLRFVIVVYLRSLCGIGLDSIF